MNRDKTCCFWGMLAVAILLLASPGFCQPRFPGNAPDHASKPLGNGHVFSLPVTFEMNRGQAPKQFVSISRTATGVLYFQRNAVSLPAANGKSWFTLHFLAPHGSAPHPEDPSGGVTNYIAGRHGDRSVIGLPLFERLRYSGIAPGVDLVFHGAQGRLEYDFDLAAGAKVADCRLFVGRATRLHRESDGSLLLMNDHGNRIRLLAPTAFQMQNGRRIPVPIQFRLHDHEIGFAYGKYNHHLPLIIDPVVAYTALIGVTNATTVSGIAVDGAGDTFITGSTMSMMFPVTSGGSSPSSSAQKEVYAAKLDPSGSSLLYSTYIPAAGQNTAAGIAIDQSGNAYIAGVTEDPNFPTTSQNLGSCSGLACNNGFVVKLSGTGSLVYSTLLGSGQQLPKAIAVNGNGQAYVAGLSADAGLKTVNAYDGTYGAGICTNCSWPFFAELNAAGTDYVFSSYFPASYSAAEPYATALAVDSQGDLYIGGLGTGVPLIHPLESGFGTTFIAEFSPDGKTLLFSTDFGANSITGLQVGTDGTIYVAGDATSDLPFTVNALTAPFPPLYQEGSPNTYMFAAAINPARTGLTYGAYLGQGDVNTATLGPDGNFYIAGQFTELAPVPLQNAIDTDIGSGGFILSLNPSGNLVNSTKFGGHIESQVPTALAVDGTGDVYVADIPGGHNFIGPLDPINIGTGSSYTDQAALGPGFDIYGYAVSIAKIAPENQPQISLSYLGPYLVLRNAGSADLQISSITLGGNLQNKWGNCGSTIPAGGSCELTVGNSAGQIVSGTVTINSNAVPSQQTFTPYEYDQDLINKTPIAPFLWVEDADLEFAPQMNGTASPVDTFKIWNVGAQAGTISSVQGGSGLQVSSDCGTLAPSAFCTVQVQEQPSSTNQGGGYILVNTTDQVTNNELFAGSADPNDADPLPFSTTLINFGMGVVGQPTLAHAVTVTNATDSAMTVPTPGISSADFSVTGNTCTGSLAAHQTCAFAITYTPSAPTTGTNDETATLSLSGDMGQVTMIGQAVAVPNITLNPATINFPTLASGATENQIVTLTNNSSSSLPVAAVYTTGSGYSETDNCVGTLASLQSCSVTVTLSPQGTLGTLAGDLMFSLQGGLATDSVPLSGVSTTDISASPSSLDFGSSTLVGAASAAQQISLTNMTSSAQPADPLFTGDFSAASSNCPATLNSGASCAVQVVFAPTTSGTQQGKMTLSFSDGSPALVVPLTGTGVAPLTLSPASGSSSSAAVTSGQTATYHLVLASAPGISGTATLSCNGAPANSTCTVTPSSTSIASDSSTDIVVSVATGVSQTASVPPAGSSIRFAGGGILSIIAACFLLWRFRRFDWKSRMALIMLLCALMSFGLLGCGGGNKGASQNPNLTPAGTYTLQVTATTGAQKATAQLTLVVN
jgi:hypothetical protein